MENERMRVRARVLLVGRARTGRALLVFSVILRIALRALTVLAVMKAAVLTVTTGGRVILALSAFAAVSAFLLCECARTLRDRWYIAVCRGSHVAVSKLISSFNAADLRLSLKIGAAARFYSLLRVSAFLLFPSAFTAFTFAVAARGASSAVLSVLAAGSIILLLCGSAFAAVSLSCVRLASTLCCYNLRFFRLKLSELEASAPKLFGYSISLGLFNSVYRRTAKILFAQSVAGER